MLQTSPLLVRSIGYLSFHTEGTLRWLKLIERNFICVVCEAPLQTLFCEGCAWCSSKKKAFEEMCYLPYDSHIFRLVLFTWHALPKICTVRGVKVLHFLGRLWLSSLRDCCVSAINAVKRQLMWRRLCILHRSQIHIKKFMTWWLEVPLFSWCSTWFCSTPFGLGFAKGALEYSGPSLQPMTWVAARPQAYTWEAVARLHSLCATTLRGFWEYRNEFCIAKYFFHLWFSDFRRQFLPETRALKSTVACSKPSIFGVLSLTFTTSSHSVTAFLVS